MASSLVRRHFPKIGDRLEDTQNVGKQKFGLEDSLFGLFHNFCINSPVFEDGINDVFCIPHTDSQNGAILVCVVMVYYYGNCKIHCHDPSATSLLMGIRRGHQCR